MAVIEVSCAVVIRENTVLATRRSAGMPHPLKWEFPGGKLRKGETPEESIVREIREELDISLIPLGLLEPVLHHYPEKSIRLIPVLCDCEEGEIAGIRLSEHDRFVWTDMKGMDELDWLEADLGIVEQLRILLG